jgi:dipeptidyl aminopeptidase/acylaminoacyl peptidase
MRQSAAGLVAASALMAALGQAAERRPLSPDDVVGLPLASDPRIAPGGDRVAFVVTRLSAPRERASEVWLVGTDGQGLLRVPLAQARAPRWSPDGRALAVVAAAAAGTAVHLYALADGSSRVLEGTAGARETAFSPDGRRLAFLRADPEAPRTDPVVVDQEPPRHTRLWTVDTAGGTPRRALDDDVTVWRFAWSPDSRRLAVLASASPLAEGQEYGSRLLSVDAAGGPARVLAEKTCPQSAPAFSPDGRTVAYLAPLGAFKERGVLHLVAADGTSPPRALASDHAGTFWEASWAADGRRVLAALGQGAEHALAAVDLDGRVTRLLPVRHSIIPLWEPVWSGDAAGRRVAYLSETESGREVFTAALDGGAPRRLTRLTAALDDVQLGAVEAVRWTSTRGSSPVEGILVSPAGAAGPTPLLVWLHGGPAYHWGLGAQVQSWAQLFAARGFRVLLPNFRGSTGYGQAWLTANVRDWGEGPMADALSGVDALIARGLADPGRLYLGGGSYGGYLTYWIVGHDARFRAAYLRAGISDPLSAFPLTDEPSFFTGYMGATAYDDPDAYRRLAPLGAAGAVRTPLLIVHGEQDARVPLMQSHLFHAALRQRGVATQLVVYPREGHSINEYDHQLDHLRRILDWYARW